MGVFSRLFSSDGFLVCGSSNLYIILDCYFHGSHTILGCHRCNKTSTHSKNLICACDEKPQKALVYNNKRCESI